MEFFERMNQRHGIGQWLVVYGGDPYNPEKPDVAWVCATLSRPASPLPSSLQTLLPLCWLVVVELVLHGVGVVVHMPLLLLLLCGHCCC